MTQKTLVETILKNKHLLSCKKDEIEIVSSLHLTIKHNQEISPYLSNAIYGYAVKNVGRNTLSVLNYNGGIITFEPGETLYIPTNLLILLLLRIEYSLKTKNGDFVNTDGNLDTYIFNGEMLQKQSIGIEDLDEGKITVEEQYNLFQWLHNKSIF